MKDKIKDIIKVMEKLDDIYILKIQAVGKRLSMKNPSGELTKLRIFMDQKNNNHFTDMDTSNCPVSGILSPFPCA